MVENTVTRQKKFQRLDPAVVAKERSQGWLRHGRKAGEVTRFPERVEAKREGRQRRHCATMTGEK